MDGGKVAKAFSGEVEEFATFLGPGVRVHGGAAVVVNDGVVGYQTLIFFFPVAVVSAIVVGVGWGQGGVV